MTTKKVKNESLIQLIAEEEENIQNSLEPISPKIKKNKKIKKLPEQVENEATTVNLISLRDSPELTKEILSKMEQANSFSAISSDIREMKKIVIHMAAQQQKMIDRINELDQRVVDMSTTLEELLNNAVELVNEQEEEILDEENLDEFWAHDKKVMNSLN